MQPAEKAVERKRLRSISGAGALPSRQMKRPRRTGAAAAQAMSGIDSPHVRPSEIIITTATSAGTRSAAPKASKRRSLARAVVFGTISQASAAPRTAIGTLTQKIERQPDAASSTPPSVGPRLRPIACAAAMIPSALARRAGPAAATRMTTLLAPAKAPLAPCRTRKAISNGRFGARPHSAEKRPNSAKPQR
jgi:hypothetical protein